MRLKLTDNLLLLFIFVILSSCLAVSLCGGSFIICFTAVSLLSLIVYLTFLTGLPHELHLGKLGESNYNHNTVSMFRSYSTPKKHGKLVNLGLSGSSKYCQEYSEVSPASSINSTLPRVRRMLSKYVYIFLMLVCSSSSVMSNKLFKFIITLKLSDFTICLGRRRF